MNDPRLQVVQGFLRLGVMIGVCGFIMIFFQPRDSAEFVLSVCSAALGGLLVVLAVIVMRRLR
ncbi:MAG: hypothetical protein JW910_07925 [Anaerolineae bacterium]|nr:hypothetical protein [Anaerolineae bacterium]